MISVTKQNKRILLIFPPLANHEHPHMGLAVIKPYLVEHGFTDCKIVDYNAVVMDRLFRATLQDNSQLFLSSGSALKCYEDARAIMRGKDNSDKLKSGVAMKMISRYLQIAGVEICKKSFDPVSFHAIEREFAELDMVNSENVVVRYLYDEVLEDIVRNSPAVIGFSLTFSSQILYTMLLCRELRKILPNIKIFLGGTQATLFYKAFLRSKTFSTLFDAIIREQGEIPTVELMNYFLNDVGTLQSIPNIAYADEDGQEIVTELIPSECIEPVCMPDYSDYPLDLYAYPKLPYMFSRGCYWGRCKFCGYRGAKTRYIISGVERVLQELSYMRNKYGVRLFHLMDDAIPASYLVEIAKGIIEKKLDICYAAYLRADKEFTLDACRLLYKSGLRTVLFGFESADNNVLKAMDKGTDVGTMVEVLQNFADAGIMNTLSIIIGYPSETKKQAQSTIAFLQENRSLYYEAYVTPFCLMSDMIHAPEMYGIYDVDVYNPIRHDINGYISLEFAYHTRVGMTPFEYLEVVKKAREVTGTAPEGANFFR